MFTVSGSWRRQYREANLIAAGIRSASVIDGGPTMDSLTVRGLAVLALLVLHLAEEQVSAELLMQRLLLAR